MTIRVALGDGAPDSQPWANLTVKGKPMTKDQYEIASVLVTAGQAVSAPACCLVACVYAGTYETDLGADQKTYVNNGSGYTGVLQGAVSSWPNPHDVQGQATSFYKGGKGFQPSPGAGQPGGALFEYKIEQVTNSAEIAVKVEVPSIWPTNAYKREYPSGWTDAHAMEEAAKTVAAVSKTPLVNITGGIAGLGGTGTSGNVTQVSPFVVGSSYNPDQDYYTTINQYAQSAQWYVISDAETLYVADGNMLMAQRPAAVISVFDPKVLSCEITYDNTSFEFTTSTAKKGKVVNRAVLQRTQSPTQITLQVICDIDDFRAGDTIYMTGCGSVVEGPWLIGERQRSCFQIYSELTLVQAMMPLSAVSRQTVNTTQATVGRAASLPGSGTVISAMLAYATKLNNDNYPYVWGGGHAQAGYPSIGVPGGPGYNGHTKGFDCSGTVAAVLAAAGLGFTFGSSSVPAEAAVISDLLAAGVIVSGAATGADPQVNIFDNPGVHIFMQLNGRYFGTATADATPSNGYGVGWIDSSGGATAGFRAYHVKQGLLLQYVSGSNATTASSLGAD